MNYYNVSQFMQAAGQQRQFLTQQLGVANHYASVHQQRRAELGQAYAQCVQDLGATLMPDLSAQSLDRAIQLTGFAALAQENPLGKMAAERVALEQRIAAIEADRRFAQRELLRHPTTGSLTRALQEMQENIGPFRNVLSRCEHPRLERLINSGYGTPSYTTGFWRMSYYEDWKAGDEILERFPEITFFSQVRDEYLRAIYALGPLEAEAARVQAEIAAGEALEREHFQCGQALSTLAPRWRAYIHQRLTGFVLQCPPQALAPRLTGAPDVELAYKRVLGLTAKTRYLDQIVGRDVASFQRDASSAVAKLDRDMMKYSRPKKMGIIFPQDQFERRFRDRGPAYQKRWHRFEKTYGTVYGFADYGRPSLLEQFLWWDLMTDGRIDGDFIPEVQQFRAQNPGYRYQPPPDDDAFDDGMAVASGVSDDSSVSYDAS